MPYLTEGLNEKIFASSDMMTNKPEPVALQHRIRLKIGFLIKLIGDVEYRSEMNVPLSAKPVLQLRGASDLQTRSVEGNRAALLRLARLDDIETVENFGSGTARGTVDGVDIGLPLAGILDLDAERARLEKAIVAVGGEIEKISRKLDNPGFIAKAPEEVVEENRRRLDEEQTRRAALEAALSRLG